MTLLLVVCTSSYIQGYHTIDTRRTVDNDRGEWNSHQLA